MSKKIDIELALHEGRYGDLIRYLDKRIDMLSKAVETLLKGNAEKPKGKVEQS